MSDKICFVVQRYGLEVNGGAELHCRQLAEHMKKFFSQIDVVTTKAIDYMTWKNEYKTNEESINGIRVLRFGVEHERNKEIFDSINSEFFNNGLSQNRELEWVEKQGPYAPKLISYLSEHQFDYKVIIFFTYLYYPTVIGIKSITNKTIMIPTAHDEPFLKMKIFDDVFLKPSAFFLNTSEEKTLLNEKYHNEFIPTDIGGVGVDLPESIDGSRFCEKYNLKDYIVYVGRIDEGKNCNELFNYFLEYKKRNTSDLKLVLMGKPVIPVPKDSDIISLGFVSDQDKFDGIDGAKALVLPSKFESLSMVVLEAMSVRTNVMVNGACTVLRGHCTKSNGAFYYNDFFEFEGELNYLLNPKNAEVVAQMKENAKAYVDEYYQWDAITQKLHNLIEEICSR